jgi:hypothetical protein
MTKMAYHRLMPQDLQAISRALQNHYQLRFVLLVALEPKRKGLLELLLVLSGEVNPVREILRVEPVARKFSNTALEVAILPISQHQWESASEPEVWEARFTGVVVK